MAGNGIERSEAATEGKNEPKKKKWYKNWRYLLAIYLLSTAVMVIISQIGSPQNTPKAEEQKVKAESVKKAAQAKAPVGVNFDDVWWSAVKNFAATLGIERSKVKVEFPASKQVTPNCFIIWVSVKKLPITGTYNYLYVPEKNKLFLVSRQIVDRYTGIFSCYEEDKARYKIWWKQVEKVLYK